MTLKDTVMEKWMNKWGGQTNEWLHAELLIDVLKKQALQNDWGVSKAVTSNQSLTVTDTGFL